MKKTNHIYEETQREAIINRPHNLFGSVKPITKERFCVSEDKITFKESTTTPALIKIFMEAVDNPIDVAIKHKLKNMTINIKVDESSIEVSDDGTGIPNIKCEDLEEYLIYKAFCKYNTSSNYKEFKNQGQKGVNGIGIKGSNTLSTEFIGISDDGNSKVTVIATENNLNHKIKEAKSSGKTGVSVKFYPDFKIIDGKNIDVEHIQRMYEYVLMQSLTYPDITFKFNGKKVSYTPKKFISLFEKECVLEEQESYFLGFLPNETDNFSQLSFVNGLETNKGGTHIDYIVNNIVNIIREKLVKKYKTIKPADIKNRLTFTLIAKDVKDIDWDGQTKESITTPNKYWIEYFKDIDFQKIANKILKTPEIIDPITEVYKIKEELKKRQEMKGLDKTVKKIKSDKYTKPIGSNDVLLICEGLSAKSALLPGLGRQGLGYYELKGKPANVYASDQKKFTENKELSELYKIIKQEGYKKIAVASDSDLDGIAINGLLIAFFKRYLQEELEAGMLYRLNTPVMALLDKNKLPKEWIYDLSGSLKEKSGLTFKYFKGLGSWTPVQMKEVIEKDGINNMLAQISYSEIDDETIDDWYSDKKADKRKEYILNNDFDLIKL